MQDDVSPLYRLWDSDPTGACQSWVSGPVARRSTQDQLLSELLPETSARRPPVPRRATTSCVFDQVGDKAAVARARPDRELQWCSSASCAPSPTRSAIGSPSPTLLSFLDGPALAAHLSPERVEFGQHDWAGLAQTLDSMHLSRSSSNGQIQPGPRASENLSSVGNVRCMGLEGAVDMRSLTSALEQAEAGQGHVLHVLKTATFTPRLPGLTKLMSRFTKDGNWTKALSIYEALPALNIHPDTTITNAAITACCKGGLWEHAVKIFEAMGDLNLERDAITYSSIISALAKSRQWQRAIEVFLHMRASRVPADAVTCCSLITAMDKGGKWQLAEQIFVCMYADHPKFVGLLDMDPPDACSTSEEDLAIIALLRKQLFPWQQLASGVTGGQEITDTGPLRRRLSTYGDGVLSAGSISETHMRQDSVVRRTGECSSPNRVCCNALLSAYARATPPQIGRAFNLLGLMIKVGHEVAPDIVSYNTVIKACGSCGDLDGAMSLYRLIEARGIEASVATYATLMAAAAKLGSAARALEIWGWIQHRRIRPNTTCLNVLIAALEQSGRWPEAKACFERMLLRGDSIAQPNTDTLNIVVASFNRQNDPQGALKAFRSLAALHVPANADTYESLLEAHSSLGNWREACEALMLTSRSGGKLTTRSFSTVLEKLAQVSREARCSEDQSLQDSVVSLTAQALELFTRCNVVGDSDMFGHAIAVFGAADRCDALIWIYGVQARQSVDTRPDAVRQVLGACRRANRLSNLVDLARQLLHDNIKIAAATRAVLGTACYFACECSTLLRLVHAPDAAMLQPDAVVVLNGIMQFLHDTGESFLALELFALVYGPAAGLKDLPSSGSQSSLASAACLRAYLDAQGLDVEHLDPSAPSYNALLSAAMQADAQNSGLAADIQAMVQVLTSIQAEQLHPDAQTLKL